MGGDVDVIKRMYERFNARDIDGVLAALADDVAWANKMDGGHVHGRKAVRDYWTRQWAIVSPHVEPVSFDKATEGSVVVKVQQSVRDLEGRLSFAKTPSRDWTIGTWRASHEANAPRNRSVGRPARGAQNSHRPHAREPGTPATACPAPPPIDANALRAPRSPPLGVALQPLGWVARSAPPRSARDRDSLAPAGFPRLLDPEVPSRANGSTADRLGACGSRAHHGARESALGRATHSRRVAQAWPRLLAAHRGPAHATSPEAPLSD